MSPPINAPEPVVVGAMRVNGQLYALTLSSAAVNTLMGMTDKCAGSVRLVTAIEAVPAAMTKSVSR